MPPLRSMFTLAMVAFSFLCFDALLGSKRQKNQLPAELRGVTSVDQFRTQLKTYLFKLAYDV